MLASVGGKGDAEMGSGRVGSGQVVSGLSRLGPGARAGLGARQLPHQVTPVHKCFSGVGSI
eukprot:1582865-Rhodomonas_salina.1